MKRKALGKGLGALLPDPEEAPGAAAGEVELSRIDPNPFQPRREFRAAELEELTASIRESGLLQPIVVRRRGERFEIVAGGRRFRAAQRLGLKSLPAQVREVNDSELLELALVENLQRQDLQPLEEAQAYQRLHEEFRLTQEDIARKVGKDRATVANAVRLLRLPVAVKELLAERRLEAGHARALLALERAEDQLSLARLAAQRALSVREVERRVALLKAPRRAHARRDANTRAAEDKLRAALGTRVAIARRGRGGTLRLQFTSEAELQRLYELLLRGARARTGGAT
jgi:ParB family transcriptional regulator, chromosome partitioning protein